MLPVFATSADLPKHHAFPDYGIEFHELESVGIVTTVFGGGVGGSGACRGSQGDNRSDFRGLCHTVVVLFLFEMADLTGFDESRRHCFDALPVDGFHAFRRERQGDRASKRRYVITLPLQVRAEGAAGFSM